MQSPKESRGRNPVLRALHQIAADLALVAEPRDLLRVVCERVRELLRADSVVVFGWNQATRALLVTACEPEGRTVPPTASGAGAAGAAFEQRQTILLDDYPSAPQALPSAVDAGIRTAAATPLIIADEPVGVLAVYRFRAQPYTADDAATLALVGTLVVAPTLQRATLQTRVAEQEVRLAGRSPATAAMRGAAPLTRREREILPLLAQGHTNREIGIELELRPGTVRNVVGRLLTKLGAKDRTHAVVLALASGLLDAAPDPAD